jgi:uncharacterized damage-inducible protein DinB
MRELLIETLTYLSPVHALADLATDDAERRLEGANHSIAELVAHMDFWQAWFCRRCEGIGEPMVATATQGWPDVARGSWPAVRQRFLDNLERAAALGADGTRLNEPVVPPVEFPPLAGYTIRDALVHVAQHNAHHLGQVILLRQLMRLWPPPSGSWSW